MVSPGFVVLALACPLVVDFGRETAGLPSVLPWGRVVSAWVVGLPEGTCARAIADAEIEINAPKRAARPAAAICHSCSRRRLSTANGRLWRFRGFGSTLPT